ncbi:unnamed protein product [Microthlaspi erraticum]|uniref:Uncharacterized protein n=1 Tax=Microthlaspi erraticum TaxID=1685480 RepID=A0A6D2KTJ3_9BRAS|nr:unnamed protein product [Microthlaspi erraticum]
MGNKLGRKRQVVEERYTKPQQGLYMSTSVDIKKLKKLILDSKLAPCYPGDDDESSSHDLEECPVCFLSKEEKSIEQIEEQRVIEAKIRIRQKEVEEEEEERMQRRMESFSSSSTSAVTADTEYGSAAEDEEIVTSQDSCVTLQPGDGELDFYLEDVMVMEAIWLSIQEPGTQRTTSPDENSEEDHHVETSMSSLASSSSPSGGLACAIAVLAERQQMVGESSSNQNVDVSSYDCHNSHYNASEQNRNHYLQGAGISYTRPDMSDDSG